jgi:hypothetical protein
MRFRRNVDKDLRGLERLAASGDIEAQRQLNRDRIRAGLVPDVELVELAIAGDDSAEQVLIENPDIIKDVVRMVYEGDTGINLAGIHRIQKTRILIDDWSDADGFLIYWHPGGPASWARPEPPRFLIERWDDPAEWEETDGGETWSVYQIEIPEDVFEEFDWVSPAEMSDSIDESAEELEELGRDPDVRARVRAVWSIASYFGWHELDHYPLDLSMEEMHERYASDGLDQFAPEKCNHCEVTSFKEQLCSSCGNCEEHIESLPSELSGHPMEGRGWAGYDEMDAPVCGNCYIKIYEGY